MLPPIVLFDLDDTILGYTPAGDEAWQALCSTYGPKLGVGADALLTAVDAARNWYWDDDARHAHGRMNLQNARREIVATAFERLGNDDLNTAHVLADAFTELREELVRPFDGALETLDTLAGGKHRLGVLTNGETHRQQKKLDRFDLARYFGVVLIEALASGRPVIATRS